MSIKLYQQLIISTLILLVSLYLYFRSTSSRSKKTSVLPRNCPIVHMFPSLIANLKYIHDYFTMVLARSGHNFRAHGPPGTGMRFFITCDPANIQHIFTKNYANFPKGAEFAAIYDIMGRTLFTIDGEPCRPQRTIFRSMFSNPRFLASMAACCCNKVENSLLPLLTRLASRSTPFDIQEVMSRLMFDLATTSLYGIDPGLLSSDMPPMDAAISMDTVMEVGFLRQGVPGFYWRLMRRLGIGFERKLSAAHKVLQGFVTEMMEKRKTKRGLVGNGEEQDGVDFLSSFIKENNADDELFRAMLIGYMLGARDTVAAALPWTFYNLAQNPGIVSIIRDELSTIASQKAVVGTGAMVLFRPEDTKSLVYLRAALYETLRLYPPGPIERKTVVADDIMPSGHEVRSGDTILISYYSVGRMEGVWGNDCLNYNPTRWLSEDGNKLRYVPPHVFVAFNSGPRMCPGKDIAIMLMKTVVAAVVWNFDVQMVEGAAHQAQVVFYIGDERWTQSEAKEAKNVTLG